MRNHKPILEDDAPSLLDGNMGSPVSWSGQLRTSELFSGPFKLAVLVALCMFIALFITGKALVKSFEGLADKMEKEHSRILDDEKGNDAKTTTKPSVK